ncbi:helix-turn-helix transcriptional regulator [Demequina salsinemoris]|uniref:helix-turn-helix transcriptional regulator n=1 Tax=Demequina salsinemoris TaxID=577470 RepID=UPI000783AD54|nr:WYL domain-containing protein [Demequina salsinemoris]
MAEKALARVTRLLSIVSLLQHRDEATFEELGELFGVTAKRIEQDINLLFVTGKPDGMPDEYLDFDPDALERKVARLWDAQGLTQVKLNAREAVALLGSLGTLVESGAAPAAAESALSKLREAVSLAPLEVVPVSEVDRDRVQPVREGLDAGLAVRVDYVDAQDRRSERVIEPHRLVSIDGLGYVECWCRRAGDYRTLRLDRIVSAEVTDDPIVRSAPEGLGFSLEARLEARVVARRGARWAFEDFPNARIVDDGEDVVADFSVSDVDWAAARLLAVGPALRSVEPAPLREALARHAEAVLAGQVIAPS